ncbi:hypothetical protein AMK34_06755 [Amycolatopsis sp. CB00013]|nr:hypothetical protein AMK34_06755 [Amycolatopsis sp. CB00013]
MKGAFMYLGKEAFTCARCGCGSLSARQSVKASFTTFRVGEEAFTDPHRRLRHRKKSTDE